MLGAKTAPFVSPMPNEAATGGERVGFIFSTAENEPVPFPVVSVINPLRTVANGISEPLI